MRFLGKTEESHLECCFLRRNCLRATGFFCQDFEEKAWERLLSPSHGNVHYHWASRGTWWKIKIFHILPRRGVIFSWNVLFNLPKNKNSVAVPRLVKNTQNSVTNTLSKTSLCLTCIKITLQFEPEKLCLRGLQVFWDQLYFCGLIFKATTSRLKHRLPKLKIRAVCDSLRI